MTSFPFSPLDPAILLIGDVNEDMSNQLWDGIQELRREDSDRAVFICLTTPGGEADIGRRMAEDIVLWQRESKRDIYLLGKTSVYSAGVTIMSVFPKEKRFLTADTTLLIHERNQSSQLKLEGPSDRVLDIAQDVITKTNNSQRLEMQGFEALAKNTKMSAEDIAKRAKQEWYLTADEALDLQLIEGVV